MVSESLARRRPMVLSVCALGALLLSYPFALGVDMARGARVPDASIRCVWTCQKGYLDLTSEVGHVAVEGGASSDFTYVYSSGRLACTEVGGSSFDCRMVGADRMWCSFGPMSLVRKVSDAT